MRQDIKTKMYGYSFEFYPNSFRLYTQAGAGASLNGIEVVELTGRALNQLKESIAEAGKSGYVYWEFEREMVVTVYEDRAVGNITVAEIDEFVTG